MFFVLTSSSDTAPDLCVDLSHCSLSWYTKGKRKNVLELRSVLAGFDLHLHWPQQQQQQPHHHHPNNNNIADEDPFAASNWFAAISRFTIPFDSPAADAATSPNSPKAQLRK